MSAQSLPRAPLSEPGLAWFQSLQFKLGLLFIVLLVILGSIAFYAGNQLIGKGLTAGNFRYEDIVSERLASDIGVQVSTAESLANAIAIEVQSRPPRSALKSRLMQLADRVPHSDLISSIGVWPEPGVYEPGVERASVLLIRDSDGHLQSREDYNDPRAVPYFREAWYTPTRYAPINHCFWTVSYQDPLSKREVVTCSMPLDAEGSFVGAVTVSFSLEAMEKSFVAATAQDSGYAILVDRDNRVLALSSKAQVLDSSVGPGHSIAELAKNKPEFNSFALALNGQSQDFLASALHSPLYDAKSISTLKDASRDMSRSDAESILAAIWNGSINRPSEASHEMTLEDDSILNSTGYATMRTLPVTHWRLLSVTPAREGDDGARYLVTQALVITMGSVALILALVWGAIRRAIVRPLRRMARELAGTEVPEAALNVSLDESNRNEVGVLAYWHNQRTRQLRDTLAVSKSTRSQLTVETNERKRVQESLARVLDRMTLTMGSIEDGVIVTDDRGVVEEMNPVAEKMLGLATTEAHGKAFDEVFVAHIGGINGAPLPSLPEIVLHRGTRLEYADDVVITGAKGHHNLYLLAAPIRNMSGRVSGCIVVFREPKQAAVGGPNTPGAEHEPLDIVTGLGGRLACERRLRTLLSNVKAGTSGHSLIIMDIDQTGRINELGGHLAGDYVIEQVAELLATQGGGSENLFRLPGDRFAIVLPENDTDSARAAAEVLRQTIEVNTFTWQNLEFQITASFGVCGVTTSGESPLDLLRRGSEAIATAKRRGRNKVIVYSPELELPSPGEDDAIWVQRIRRGIDENLFHLTTQWISPARAHAPDGHVFEILLSLEDEEGFWAPPSRFLPVADRRGLSTELDRWVVTHTLAALESNAAAYERMAFCSINISGASVADPQFLDFIAEEFNRRTQLTVRKLCFEVGEETVSAHPQRAQRFCDAMRSIGCRVAIDQYGGRRTSDISVLRRLPVDFLKLDARQFRDIADDPVEHMLAESTLRVAHHLRRRVIVTSLEDDNHTAIWRKLGADYCQGYVVAKPSPVVFSVPNGM